MTDSHGGLGLTDAVCGEVSVRMQVLSHFECGPDYGWIGDVVGKGFEWLGNFVWWHFRENDCGSFCWKFHFHSCSTNNFFIQP